MGAHGATQAHVAIVDPCEVFVHGLTDVLTRAGIVVEETEDLDRWVSGKDRRGLVFGVASSRDLGRIAELREKAADLPIVGVVNSTSQLAWAAALASGANTVLVRESDPGQFVAVVAAALEGYSLLPAGVVRDLGSSQAQIGRPDLSEEEATILQSLVCGETIGRLASRLNYSHRETSRRVTELSLRIGAKNRAGAVAKAAVWGFAPDGAHELDLRGSTQLDVLLEPSNEHEASTKSS
ncbi:hypothetical protein BMS3Bbin02_00875 [bacterium BMS3Bbin02]|nr:hypothetical protein BMS3Bbin02_00875 [bacterium BMS3Bbin02]